MRINARNSRPAGSYINFTGTAEAAERAREQLGFRSLLAGLGIILLLSMTLRNLPNVLLVLLNLPFALVGGVMILLLTRTALSLGAMVGFITLFGITLRDSLMMIAHFHHLVSVQGLDWSKLTERCGASERLAPILMTTLVTGLGLLPLVIGLHRRPGNRRTDGPGDSRRADHLNHAEPAGPALPGGPMGPVYQTRAGTDGVTDSPCRDLFALNR